MNDTSHIRPTCQCDLCLRHRQFKAEYDYFKIALPLLFILIGLLSLVDYFA